MSERVSTYLLTDTESSISMDRSAFYTEQIAEFKKQEKPSRAVEVINVFIFNTRGEILIQKRSFQKTHNAGLLDKSIGGHIVAGDAADYTVMVETIQELQTPSIVLANQADFIKTFNLLKDYLTTIAIVQKVKTQVKELEKIVKGEKVVIANKLHLYFGVYNGRVRPADQEAKGILYYTLEELDQELANTPTAFTSDIQVLLKEFRKPIEEFIKLIAQP